MSLATAAKEAPGLTPSTAHASTPSSAGRVFSAPDLKSGRRLGPALLQCLGMSRRVASGQGVGRAPHHHSFQGAGIVFQEDRHCPPLSLPADFVSIWRFVGLFVLFFFSIVLKSGRNMKDFVLIGGLILAPRPAANWHPTSTPDRLFPRLSVQLLIMWFF